MTRSLPTLLLLSFLSSCPPPEPDPAPALDPDRLTDDPCAPDGSTRCIGAVFQSCQQGYWYNEQVCSGGQVCNREMACVDCEPLSGPACDGDQVRACNPDGSFGQVMDACAPGECEYGHCDEEDCPEGTDLIYVVDDAYRLLSFDPRDDAFTFHLLGYLACPAAWAWPGWGGGEATPFSMSVDRTGRAWVLYTSGEIFWVETDNPEVCTLSPWQPGTSSFELFGMGFVSDEPGSEMETLYVAGGTVDQMLWHETGRLGALDPEDIAFDVVGGLSPSELGPELTGTGDAELFAYFPGTWQASVALLDRSTGTNAQAWAVPTLPGSVTAWAFAHWGGRFFIFVSWDDGFGGYSSDVLRFDRESGDTVTVLQDTGYRVVGAGVSTCAPTVMD